MVSFMLVRHRGNWQNVAAHGVLQKWPTAQSHDIYDISVLQSYELVQCFLSLADDSWLTIGPHLLPFLLPLLLLWK